MDNFHFDMTSEGKEKLRAALALFNPPGNKVIGYSVDDKNGMVFYWYEGTGVSFSKFPFKMTLEAAADFAYTWLEESADYGLEPDHDGDNGKGWRLCCDGWGHVEGVGHNAFASIQPRWAMYGK